MLRTLLSTVIIATLALSVVGCAPTFGPQARNGITFYCPGAGNIDFGDQGIRAGLEKAGYRGQVASVVWTVSLNPAIDQLLRVNARDGAARLAKYIRKYHDQFPDGEINVVGLSAGTGVAIWALEDLPHGYSVDNVVLLSSSLSYDYDVSKALKRVKGKIYNFYSSHDAVLTVLMKPVGTIDGKLFTDGAGAVGLTPPSSEKERVVNTAWRPEFSHLGYGGGHMDSTSPDFVTAYIAPHLIRPESPAQLDTKLATLVAAPAPVAHQD